MEEVSKHVGEEVVVYGWVQNRRDMGKILFLDLRDVSGTLQVVVPPGNAELSAEATRVRSEFVVAIRGKVNARPPKNVNANLVTGTVELEAFELKILNESKTPPFEIDKDTRAVNEETRLKYRYIDLRSERLRQNIVFRHQVVQKIRHFLNDRRFHEIETPVLTKGTPEGAREFLVPSRLHPGKFYVLPQSPQQFKQLLMVSGLDRYYQVAKCFRDEDQRGDRQPEFTQIDLEMSFVEREDVMDLIESLLIEVVSVMAPEKKIQAMPFPRMSYKEAMEKYGIDRPDVRENKDDPNLLAFTWVVDFPFFEKTEDGGWTFTHNPFSRAVPEHREALLNKENIGDILTTQYDIVLNGFEIGGGSIRNHEPLALQRVFEIMGLPLDEIRGQFGHMLESFEHGAPPHGGIALGFDRLVAILRNEPNIREVIAFPKTGDARDPLMDAPSEVSERQMKDVHIQLRPEVQKEQK
ncbi:MAG: aspartate--tRNA ligase [bacterium]|nr:aspartate--tRNA ligase [bacterium]